MFVDIAKVRVKAGDGGNGVVSFRHEKFVDRGGPDGGDGGNGGDVVLVGSRNQDSLVAFRYQKLLRAESGQNGAKQRKHGKTGKTLEVPVPVGTVVTDTHGSQLADITQDKQRTVIAHGGKGGFGNAHFVSSTRQAPKVAEKGEKGQESDLLFELKMIADVGLVGLPNAGKSTLLASVSNARPKIANYAFTTMTPNLGVVDIGNKSSLLVADIPGLIEGASQGKGLGDEFLRHVERTAVLIHLIDVYQYDVAQAYQTIQAELKAYKVNLSRRPQLVALNKADGYDEQQLKVKMTDLRKVLPRSRKLFVISAKSKIGVKELLFAASQAVKNYHTKQKTKTSKASLPIIRLQTDDDGWRVTKKGKDWTVSGAKIERFAARTDFNSDAGVDRLRDIMKKLGVIHELERRGVKPGQRINFPKHGNFEY